MKSLRAFKPKYVFGILIGIAIFGFIRSIDLYMIMGGFGAFIALGYVMIFQIYFWNNNKKLKKDVLASNIKEGSRIVFHFDEARLVKEFEEVTEIHRWEAFHSFEQNEKDLYLYLEKESYMISSLN